MKELVEQYALLFHDLGEYKMMTLSTSLQNKVTSRTMSILVADEKFYFQTGKPSRKYEQIKGNPMVSLCWENVQIEGRCVEIGRPSENPEFCERYRQHFPDAYERYSNLEVEIAFEVNPVYIQKWTYENGVPCLETYDFINMRYNKERYLG